MTTNICILIVTEKCCIGRDTKIIDEIEIIYLNGVLYYGGNLRCSRKKYSIVTDNSKILDFKCAI